MAFQKLESAFTRYIGPAYTQTLQAKMCDRPAILLGGDQLTGKSTMSKKLASYFQGGQMYSVGTMFREQAAIHGISVPEYSRILIAQLEDPNSEKRFDVDLDFRTCEVIAGKEIKSKYCVIEGRQPAVMGQFMSENFGKTNIFRIYLTCSPRERAVRFIEREFGAEYSKIADESLPLVHNAYQDFSSSGVGELIAQLNFNDGNKIAAAFIDNQRRDLDDRTRYKDLYGMDYRDAKHYDLVVDTMGKSSEENFQFTLSQLEARAPLLWHVLNKPSLT